MLSPPRSPKNLRGKCHLLKNGTTCSSSLCIFGGKVASGKLFLNKLTSVTNVTKQELQLKYFAEELFIYLFNCSGLLSWHLLDPQNVEDKFLSKSIMQNLPSLFLALAVQGVDHMHIKSVTTDLVTNCLNSLGSIKPCS